MAAFVLALDVGTSSVRAILYAAEGATQGAALPHTEVQIAHTVTATPDGRAELDPELLFAETSRAIDGALARVPRDGTIVGVALSTLWHGVLGVEASGAAITPLYTWADTRAARAAAHLRTRLDEAAVHARTGCVLHPSYLPARLLWLAQAQPQVWQRVARWLSFGEYLHLRLFGRAVCSVSMASGTGLLDVHRCTWDEEMLAAIGLDPARLSPLGDVADALRGCRPRGQRAGRRLPTCPGSRPSAMGPAATSGAAAPPRSESR